MKKLITIFLVGLSFLTFAEENPVSIEYELLDNECVNLVTDLEYVECDLDAEDALQVVTAGSCTTLFQVYNYDSGSLVYKKMIGTSKVVRSGLSSFVNGASFTLLSRTNNKSEEDRLKKKIVDVLNKTNEEILKYECE